jgi:hypothetical protein
MSKFKGLIKEARKTENHKTINTANVGSVNLTIKVPLQYRRFWLSQAKARGLTLTQVITESLNEKLGEP